MKKYRKIVFSSIILVMNIELHWSALTVFLEVGSFLEISRKDPTSRPTVRSTNTT